MRKFGAILFLAAVPMLHAAAVGGYVETVLLTSATDSSLINPWGISSSPTSPFWISDNGSGKSTVYNTLGVKLLTVNMPAGSENLTGQVFNGTGSFNGDSFLFATENGTITGWRGALSTTAETLYTVAGAEYKGLAISNNKATLYAANFAAGTIDVFNSGVGKAASISDPSVPAGYAPFNIQNIGGKLYVTYALRGTTGDDVAGAGHGFVSVFDPTTNTFTRLVSQGALNSPWGIAVAPNGFGQLSGDLLVGNFGDGLIDAYDPLSGTLVGTLANLASQPIVNDGLWGLQFGNGGNGGAVSTLYITAGPNDETGGVFAAIATPEPSTLLLAGAGIGLLFLRRRLAVRG